jgi:hypothetical protein
MTAYKHHIPGVTIAQESSGTPAALEAKRKRRELLEQIRRRRAENYKRFLARCKPQSHPTIDKQSKLL